MPITLTTAFNPGDFDAGKTYTHAKIVKFAVDIELGAISVTLKFGNVVGGVWTPSVLPGTMLIFAYGSEMWETISEKATNEGESVYECLKRVLYAQVMVDNPALAGVVE